jgi:carbamoyltransferase
MAKILGISAFYHDSAACLVEDGDIIAAAQEERFTRKKHDFSFPKNAVEYCLKEGKIGVGELDYVVFYDKPFIKFERIVETYLAYVPRGLKSFLMSLPIWLKEKLLMTDLIRDELKGYTKEILFTQHHESHAASAFYPSPFDEAAFLTIDGVGEWATASFGVGKGSTIEPMYELHFPHSLGMLYSAFTYYAGFKVNSGEYKLMGLAPYGEPKYVDLIYDKLIDLKEDGSFKMDMRYFDYCAGLKMTGRRFNALFGGPPRKPESKITRREMDIAASIQVVTEEIVVRMARHIKKVTGQKYLCLAGGVALNCVANGKLLRSGLFENIWIQPASGDAGGALGAALTIWYTYLGNERKPSTGKDRQKASYLGPLFTEDAVEAFLKERNVAFTKLAEAEIPETVADLIASEKVVGWFQGRMEFGPRALGGRSIIGDARSPRMQSVMNLKIKFRESFRPFAPSAMNDRVSEWFELDRESPYMLLVADVKKEKLKPMNAEEKDLQGIDKLKVLRSEIPAVTHVDNSARIQTVSREDNPLYYGMIESFYRRTGCPVIINTSFNVRGEPIVCTPEDAYKCFMRTNMDYLIMGRYLLDKEGQQPLSGDIDWSKEYALD